MTFREKKLSSYLILIPIFGNEKLREMYQDKIDIRIGVEIGLQPHLGNAYKEYVSSYPFDFVIGSVHVVNRMDPYYGEFLKIRQMQKLTVRHFWRH